MAVQLRSTKYTTKELVNGIVFFSMIFMSINFLLYAYWGVDAYKNVIRVFISVMLLGALALGKSITRNSCLSLIIAVYCIVINGAVSPNVAFLIFAVTFYMIDTDLVLHYMNIANGLVVFVVVITLALGLKENVYWTHQGRSRYFLGFMQPNYAGLFTYSTSVIYFLSLEKIRPKHLITVGAINCIIFMLTNSRTSFVGVALFVLIYLLGKRKKR